MQVIDSVSGLQAWADAERAAGRRIALVPTMGALHRGHLALVDAARRQADRVVVSIFVNPAQFDRKNDLTAYPRPMDADLSACREAGVDVVFAPTPDELYGAGYQTWIEVSDLQGPLCGATRSGHFRGVATVVAKLLIAAKPHCAVFGEKDFQQLALLRRLVRDLGFDTEVVGVATVREPDGLALSSRNVHLHGESRAQALAVVRALDAAESAARAGEQRRTTIDALVRAEIEKSPLARIDYAELRDPESLELAPDTLEAPTLLALAVHFPKSGNAGDAETVRLIDNRVLPAPATDHRPGPLPAPATDHRPGPLPAPATDHRPGPLPAPATDHRPGPRPSAAPEPTE